METKSILHESNQTCHNQLYTFRINFGPFRSGTKNQVNIWCAHM